MPHGGAALVTWPKVDGVAEQVWLVLMLQGTGIDRPMPEYCTVFNALFAVSRTSRLRVSPNETVRERDPLIDTVPGSSIELRVAVAVSAGGQQSACHERGRVEPFLLRTGSR